MDLQLDGDQSARLDALRALVARCSPPPGGLPGHHDEGLVAAVRADGSIIGVDVPLLDRILLVEEAARLAAPLSATAVLLIAPLCGLVDVTGPVAITVEGAATVVRDGAHASVVVDLTSAGARTARLGADERQPAASGLLANAGVVSPESLAACAWRAPTSPVLVYRLGLAAEIAGAAGGAIDHTAAYLRRRVAFGQPLGSRQALRHRLSERAVDAAGTSALARLAAWHGDAASISSAVAHAAATAAAVVPELHQLCGAQGFVADFGLSRWTMLVQALRVELGGSYDAAAEHAAARWPL